MQGQLLVAHPLLNDGYFNRSVVYMTSYSEEGAAGFCLNFKTQFLLRDVRPNVSNGNFPIYEGGPVARNQLFYLHTLGHDISDSLHVGADLFVGGDFNELLHLIEHGKVRSYQVRFFAGYSGWSENQLDGEIGQKHWIVQEQPPEGLLGNTTEDLWGTQLAQIKNSYGIFANFSFDPSMN